MDRASAMAALRAHEGDLHRLGVERLFMFGSMARDAAGAESDVDLFFDHPEGSLGLFALMDLKAAANRILERPVDLMTRRSLHPMLRADVEATALLVF